NGRYVMTGSGPVIISDDGSHLRSQPLDCSLPETCITDPSGGVSQELLSPVVFAQHRFFAGLLASPDGVDWSVASKQAPSAFMSGHFFSLDGSTLSSQTSA